MNFIALRALTTTTTTTTEVRSVDEGLGDFGEDEATSIV